MSTGRAQELWRHRETGEIYLVEIEDERVVSASGPLTEDQVSEAALAYKQVAQGRTPAYSREAAEVEQRRDQFVRERLATPRSPAS